MASTTLTRTPASGGNQKTWTLSSWVKNSYGGMFFCVDSYGASKSLQSEFYQGSDFFAIAQYTSGSSAWGLTTNRLFRDRSAWYHIVVSVDTTQATESDRVKIYINGVQETSFSTATYPSLNYDTGVNTAIQHMIGNRPSASNYFDGSMSHFHFIDGTAYDASTFGETDSTSGIWKPKASPTGITYGTNGFFLKFENSGAMGTDSSGNSNTFTVSGTLTQNVDTPSNNFATMNPLAKGVSASANPTFANGNTTITNTVRQHGFSSLGVSSGKWYTEFKITSGATSSVTGISDGSYTTYLGHGTGDYSYRGSDGTWYNNQSATSYGSALSDNDIVGVALDLDNNKLYFSINGTFQNSGDPTSGATGTGAISISAPATGFYHFATGNILTSGTITAQSNFGQGYFGTTAVASANADDGGLGAMEYDVPANYRILCTKNIKDYG
jgi:hypothetical protein